MGIVSGSEEMHVNEQLSDAPRDAKALWNAQAERWVAANRQDKLTRRRETMMRFISRHITTGSVLDIGCGDGSLCRELARRGFDVYGCDVSEELVTVARGMLSDAVSDADDRIRPIADNRIPFDRRFDLVTILGVLVYIPRHVDYLRQVAQHLNPGGLLVASSTQRISLRTAYDVGRHLRRPAPKNPEWRHGIVNLLRTGTWSGGFLPVRGSGRTFSAAGLERAMRTAGFVPLDRFYVYHLEPLDRRPLERSRPATVLARWLGWRQTLAARWPATDPGGYSDA